MADHVFGAQLDTKLKISRYVKKRERGCIYQGPNIAPLCASPLQSCYTRQSGHHEARKDLGRYGSQEALGKARVQSGAALVTRSLQRANIRRKLRVDNEATCIIVFLP